VLDSARRWRRPRPRRPRRPLAASITDVDLRASTASASAPFRPRHHRPAPPSARLRFAVLVGAPLRARHGGASIHHLLRSPWPQLGSSGGLNPRPTAASSAPHPPPRRSRPSSPRPRSYPASASSLPVPRLHPRLFLSRPDLRH
jgi:hypothetical protein